MKVASILGQTSLFDFHIEHSCAKIGFYIIATGGVSVDLDLIEVDLTMKSKRNGDVIISREMKLSDLLELSSQNEGFYVKNNLFACGTVDLSKSGAISLTDADYISLELEGLNPTWKVEIFTLDAPILTNSYIVYEAYDTNGTVRGVNISKATNLCITDSIEEVQIRYANGRTCTYTWAELQLIAIDTNDLVSVLGLAGGSLSPVFGFNRFIVIDVTDAEEMTIIPANGVIQTRYYIIKNKLIDLPSNAMNGAHPVSVVANNQVGQPTVPGFVIKEKDALKAGIVDEKKLSETK